MREKFQCKFKHLGWSITREFIAYPSSFPNIHHKWNDGQEKNARCINCINLGVPNYDGVSLEDVERIVSLRKNLLCEYYLYYYYLHSFACTVYHCISLILNYIEAIPITSFKKLPIGFLFLHFCFLVLCNSFLTCNITYKSALQR